MTLRTINNPEECSLLYCSSNPITNLDRAEEIVKELKSTRLNLKLDGLAAPQLGYNYEIFVLLLSNGKEITCINPLLLEVSELKSTRKERCASIPGKYYTTIRPYSIVVWFKYIENSKWQSDSLTLSSKDAAMWMHEFHHLKGVMLNHCWAEVKEEESKTQ